MLECRSSRPPNDIKLIGERNRQETGMRTEVLGLGVVAYTPNPVGLVHPGVGHSLIADAPSGAWTNERHDPQK
jgi:hypothetical protein